MIAVTERNLNHVASLAAHLDGCLRARGLPRLSDDQCEALWNDSPGDAARLLEALEMRHGLAIDDTQPVREALGLEALECS